MRVTGPGAHSYAEFTAFCEEDPRVEDVIYLTWAHGFMAAWNFVKAIQHLPTKNLCAHASCKQAARIRALFKRRHPEAFYMAVAAYHHSLPVDNAPPLLN
jgi:hypothetical protein